jgi:3-oxoacyl-[acyl-carrier protein] reductase
MSGAVSVITGSRKGIGRHLAECALAAGSIVVGCSRQESDLRHERYEHVQADVADETAMVRLFAQVRRTHGRVDHLINCAGIASMNHVLLTPGAAFRAIYETNVFGTFYCSREAAKLMQTRRFGRIVNFSSVALPLKLEGEAAYASSKAAVVALTGVMARELAPFGITVNAIGPTPIDTDLIRGVPKDRIAALIGRQAIDRFGTVADVANVVNFLLSPESAFVTGQTVYLGGV